jgi:hypothetical protein
MRLWLRGPAFFPPVDGLLPPAPLKNRRNPRTTNGEVMAWVWGHAAIGISVSKSGQDWV